VPLEIKILADGSQHTLGASSRTAPRIGGERKARARSLPIHLKAFGPGARTRRLETMTEEADRPRFRDHLHEMKKALGGIGKDVEIDVVGAPRLAKEGTKNVLARAAGIRRTPMQEWTEPGSEDPK